MLRIPAWVSVSVLVLETALVGTVAHAQGSGGLNNQGFAWAISPGPTQGINNWTGFYTGISGGGAWSPNRNILVNETFNHDPFFDGTFGSRNVQGGFGGAQFGYRSQHGQWVFGGELNAYGGSINGKSREVLPYLTAGNSMTFSTRECMDFFSTWTGRVGYAVDRVLIYGLAGGAVANTDTHFKMTDTFGFDAVSTSKAVRGGFVAGAGLEYQVSANLSLRAEYDYIDLGKAFSGGREFSGAAPSLFNISSTSRLNYSMGQFGINYKFGPGTTALQSLTR